MSKKRSWTVASALRASVAAGCFFGYLQAPPSVHAYQAKPLVVRRTDKMYKEGSSRSDVSDQTFARRSDGSWSFSYTGTAPDGSYEHTLEYFDLARTIYVHTESVTRSVMTRAIQAAEIPTYLELEFTPCGGLKAGYEGGPHSGILGYDTILVSRTDKEGRDLRWVAPALDCYPLRGVYRTTDGRHDDFEVSAVEEVEPPAVLFEVPSGYVERSPKEIEALYAEHIPGAQFLPKEILELAEGRYQAARPAQH